jgi:hypothetical protein
VGVGKQLDELDALPLPTRETDRMVVGRSGDLFRMDVADWRGGISERRSPIIPRSADFPTWVNQDYAAITDLDDGFSLTHDDSNTGDSLQMRVRAIPPGTWNVTLGCIRGHKVQRFIISGLILRESSTGKLMTWGFGHASSGGIFINAWINPTNFWDTRKSYNEDRPQKQWFKAAKNGSNMDFYASPDGVNYSLFFTQALTRDFTSAPDQWGAFINPCNNITPRVPVRLDVIDWSE